MNQHSRLLLTCLLLSGLNSQTQAMTWTEMGRQNQPAGPSFQRPEPVEPRFWQTPPTAETAWPFDRPDQPPTLLLYWSWQQTGSYDNPWTLGWRDGWWAPPIRWGTPLSPWTQYQMYQWWNRQAPGEPNPQRTYQP